MASVSRVPRSCGVRAASAPRGTVVTVEALAQIEDWPVGRVSVAVVSPAGVIASRGPLDLVMPWASVTKVASALACLVAIEEGIVDLDEPAGPPGSTLRHLLAHASGLAPDEQTPLGGPGLRRVYSNAGIEVAAELVADRARMPFEQYLVAGVLEPLGMASAALLGSPSWGMEGACSDLALLGRELLAPRLVAHETLDEAVTATFPGLDGVVPGFGRQEPNDWGLGSRCETTSSPHWTGARNSPRHSATSVAAARSCGWTPRHGARSPA